MWHFLTLSIFPIFEGIHTGDPIKSLKKPVNTWGCTYVNGGGGFLSSGNLLALFCRSLQRIEHRERWYWFHLKWTVALSLLEVREDEEKQNLQCFHETLKWELFLPLNSNTFAGYREAIWITQQQIAVTLCLIELTLSSLCKLTNDANPIPPSVLFVPDTVF